MIICYNLRMASFFFLQTAYSENSNLMSDLTTKCRCLLFLATFRFAKLTCGLIASYVYIPSKRSGEWQCVLGYLGDFLLLVVQWKVCIAVWVSNETAPAFISRQSLIVKEDWRFEFFLVNLQRWGDCCRVADLILGCSGQNAHLCLN